MMLLCSRCTVLVEHLTSRVCFWGGGIYRIEKRRMSEPRSSTVSGLIECLGCGGGGEFLKGEIHGSLAGYVRSVLLEEAAGVSLEFSTTLNARVGRLVELFGRDFKDVVDCFSKVWDCYALKFLPFCLRT